MERSRRSFVRARCQQALDQLDIVARPAHQLSVADIRDRVQRWRGRPLHLMPMATGRGWPSGMWVETEHADVVLYEAASSALHSFNIIAHEFGHMVLDHVGNTVPAAARSVIRPLDTLDSSAPVMLRTGFVDHDEHEAEVFAALVCARLGDHRIPAVMLAEEAPQDLVSRLLAALADRSEPR